jgi:hypothetical protein
MPQTCGPVADPHAPGFPLFGVDLGVCRATVRLIVRGFVCRSIRFFTLAAIHGAVGRCRAERTITFKPSDMLPCGLYSTVIQPGVRASFIPRGAGNGQGVLGRRCTAQG